MSIAEEIKQSFKKGDYLVKLIYINIGVFLVINIFDVVAMLFGTGVAGMLVDYLAMPAYLPQLLWRVWSPISYMFVHKDFLHILFNMLWLFWMGRIFVEYLGQQKLLSIYLLGGLAGAALYLLAYNTLPAFSPSPFNPSLILGASGAVMAIVLAIATYLPNYTINLMFIGPVRLKYLALAMVVLDVLGMAGSNSGGHIAHLGGATLGILWGYQLRKGTDIFKSVHPIIGKTAQIFKRKDPPIKVHYKSSDRFSHIRKDPPIDQGKMDKILDKIAKSGYDSLTKEEKDLLFIMSNKKNK